MDPMDANLVDVIHTNFKSIMMGGPFLNHPLFVNIFAIMREKLNFSLKCL
jgi:hypothetical protein